MMPVAAWAVAFFYPVWKNTYFGNHKFPTSDAEVIADGISVLLIMMAIIVTQNAKR